VGDARLVDPEKRMLIDGVLVDADSGGTFDNVNPATEEIIGQVADGSTADIRRAIAAARRAFDETDWSTNHAFRQRCLGQLQDALVAEKEQFIEQLILEVGCPRMLTENGPQLAWPLADALRYPTELIDDFAWETRLPDVTDQRGGRAARMIRKEPVGVVGAITPWNYPFEVRSASWARPSPPATPWCSSPLRTRRGTPR
jgi:aldehyde dehydrogenase (NAD+)